MHTEEAADKHQDQRGPGHGSMSAELFPKGGKCVIQYHQDIGGHIYAIASQDDGTYVVDQQKRMLTKLRFVVE